MFVAKRDVALESGVISQARASSYRVSQQNSTLGGVSVRRDHAGRIG